VRAASMPVRSGRPTTGHSMLCPYEDHSRAESCVGTICRARECSDLHALPRLRYKNIARA